MRCAPPYPATPTDSGPDSNAAVWDLHEEGARRIAFKADMGDPETGPLALPGTYTLELRADDHAATTALEVLADPRSPAGIADLRTNHALALSTRDALTRLSQSIDRVRAVLLDAITAASQQVDAIEGTLHNPEAITNSRQSSRKRTSSDSQGF